MQKSDVFSDFSLTTPGPVGRLPPSGPVHQTPAFSSLFICLTPYSLPFFISVYPRPPHYLLFPVMYSYHLPLRVCKAADFADSPKYGIFKIA
jgi:hypothetical protein